MTYQRSGCCSASAQPGLGSAGHLQSALDPLCWQSWPSSKCTEPHLPPHAIQRPNKEVFVQLVLVPQDGALLQRHRHGCPVFGTFAAGEAHSVQLPANLKHRQAPQVGPSHTRQAVQPLQLCKPRKCIQRATVFRKKHLLEVSTGTFHSWPWNRIFASLGYKTNSYFTVSSLSLATTLFNESLIVWIPNE